MVLLKILPIFLLIFISSWTSTTPCEDGFSPDKVLISFAKKQMGEKVFEKELGTQWSEKMTQKTKDWNREEASQFLDFLTHRFGEENTLEVLKAFSEFEGTITPGEFINRVHFYDQINKNIVNHTLLFHADFNMLMTNSNPTHIRRIHSLIESYIGAEGASYVMWHLLIYRDMLREAYSTEMRKVMQLVEYYTNKHGVTTDTPTHRADFFREWTLHTNRNPADIKFRNFMEFLTFNKTAAETLREKTQGEEDNIHGRGNMDMFQLQFELYLKIFPLFSGFYYANYRNLKKTIKILKQYITPAEIAELLINEPGIYIVDPKRLQEVIDIFKSIHEGVEYTGPETLETKLTNSISLYISYFIAFSFYPEKRSDLADYIDIQSGQKRKLKEFIGSIIRTHRDAFLLADPTNLTNTTNTLASFIEKNSISTALKTEENNISGPFQRALLKAGISDVNYMERIIHLLEPHLTSLEIAKIITKHLPSILKINNEQSINTIEDILRVFDKYINKQDIFLQRIEELFELDSELIPELLKRLTDMANTSDHKTMEKKLSSLPLSEILSSSPKTKTDK